MEQHDDTTAAVPLPPRPSGCLAGLLDQRRSTWEFEPGGLSAEDLATLLWAGYGRRLDGGGIVPSAHGLWPLSLTVLAGRVSDVPVGVYRYRPEQHDLVMVSAGDRREAVARATLADGHWLARAPALIIITGDMESARRHFHDQPPTGERRPRYVWLEAGHVSENVFLAAADRNLGAVLVGGFHDDQVAGALGYANAAAPEMAVPPRDHRGRSPGGNGTRPRADVGARFARQLGPSAAGTSRRRLPPEPPGKAQ